MEEESGEEKVKETGEDCGALGLRQRVATLAVWLCQLVLVAVSMGLVGSGVRPCAEVGLVTYCAQGGLAIGVNGLPSLALPESSKDGVGMKPWCREFPDRVLICKQTRAALEAVLWCGSAKNVTVSVRVVEALRWALETRPAAYEAALQPLQAGLAVSAMQFVLLLGSGGVEAWLELVVGSRDWVESRVWYWAFLGVRLSQSVLSVAGGCLVCQPWHPEAVFEAALVGSTVCQESRFSMYNTGWSVGGVILLCNAVAALIYAGMLHYARAKLLRFSPKSTSPDDP